MRQWFSSRSSLCIVVLASLAATGCQRLASASGLSKITLQPDWCPQPKLGVFYTALVKSYYKDAPDLTIEPGGPYVVVDQQVSAGVAQFGMTSSDKILGSRADGLTLVEPEGHRQFDLATAYPLQFVASR